jgi:hypothetical protein
MQGIDLAPSVASEGFDRVSVDRFSNRAAAR